MTTIFRATADASSIYRERTGVQVARAGSSADTGNLAAVTKDSTFEVTIVQEAPVPLPQTNPAVQKP
jgi:hypothetical protein